MKKIHSGLLLLAMFLMAGCAGMGTSLTDDISIEVEADPRTNFAGYKTYMWLGASAIVNDPFGQWEPPAFDADAEIKFLIDQELRARDMTETSATPDLLIGFAAGIDMTNVEYKENPNTRFKSLESVPKGALVILMVDARTGVLIWAASAQGDVQGNTGEAAKKRLKFAVKGMLDRFPGKK